MVVESSARRVEKEAPVERSEGLLTEPLYLVMVLVSSSTRV